MVDVDPELVVWLELHDLIRVLLHTFTSSRRRRWTREYATADLPEVPAPDHTSAVDTTDAVMRRLDRLSRDQRTAVVLRFYAHPGEH